MYGFGLTIQFTHSRQNTGDICAPEAILRSVGGCAFDFEGNPLVYNESEQTSNVKGVVAVRSADVKNELVEFTRTLL